MDRATRKVGPADRPYKPADGSGMHLLTKPTGGKPWRLDCRHGGKRNLRQPGRVLHQPVFDAGTAVPGFAPQELAGGVNPDTITQQRMSRQHLSAAGSALRPAGANVARPT